MLLTLLTTMVMLWVTHHTSSFHGMLLMVPCCVAGVTKVAHIQRSCGYALRPTLSIAEIGKAVSIIKAQDPSCVVLVDNCYGEFTEELEPCAVGADLLMGSLIKNGGGTIAPGGGYVAGRSDLIGAVGARLAAPGIGIDAGGVSGTTLRLMFQGERWT